MSCRELRPRDREDGIVMRYALNRLVRDMLCPAEGAVDSVATGTSYHCSELGIEASGS